MVDYPSDEAMDRDRAVLATRASVSVLGNSAREEEGHPTALIVTMKMTVARIRGECRRLHSAAAQLFQRKAEVDLAIVIISGTP